MRRIKALQILIVEDNTINGLMLKLTLEKLGITSTVCANGKLALDALEMNEYNLILMDIQMPEMNGIDCLEIIREKGLTMPVIALTGYSDKDELKQFIDCGFNDYLVKPVSEGSLANKIGRFFK